jgi:dihydroorotase
MEDIANVLRKGDVMCHVYHGTGNTILGEDGQIINEIHKARERGVLFDVANGKMNCSHFVSNEALKQKFLPDIISTDMTGDKLYYASHARSLPFVMSKYISFGMSLYDVVRCTTETPAKVMGMEGQIGTLAPGAFADVSIMKMVDKQATYHDTFGAAYVGNQLLIPQMTISNGEIAFGQIDFNLSEIP